jgi:hypothetical protein
MHVHLHEIERPSSCLRVESDLVDRNAAVLLLLYLNVTEVRAAPMKTVERVPANPEVRSKTYSVELEIVFWCAREARRRMRGTRNRAGTMKGVVVRAF